MIESVSLKEMQKLQQMAPYCTSNDYVFVHVEPSGNEVRDIQRAFRFNGMIITLVVGGEMNVTVNMEYYTLRTNALLIAGPNSIVSVDYEKVNNLEAYVLFISTEFLHDLNFEIVVLNSLPVMSNHGPLTMLQDNEVKMLGSYFELLDLNAKYNDLPEGDHLLKSINRSLFTAIFYQLMVIGARQNRIEDRSEEDGEENRPRTRRKLLTHEFMRLVRRYYRQERSVNFYAKKLCVSPKYLSIVVKGCTGHTASKIIDDHVLMECKNLLRFSGRNIQQVAYEMNFTNQSSFGKYFKHLTGMSPSEFQNS